MSHEDFELAGFTPYLLNQAAEAQSLVFSKIYKDRYGMLRTEWRVLFHLGRYGEMTAKEISESAMIHKTKISRAVRDLEVKRFLAREVIETDRRVERLTLRPPGKDAFDYLVRAAADYEDRLAARLGSGEAQLLKRLLKKLG
nr:MarR family transcriptional regulator [Puniceibacterium antarcticum]